jgi:uncharacterized membrane protein YfhO
MPKESATVRAFQKWIQAFVEKAISEIDKDDNRKHIHHHIIVPLLHILYTELYPYILFVVVILLFILAICIACLFFIVIAPKRIKLGGNLVE